MTCVFQRLAQIFTAGLELSNIPAFCVAAVERSSTELVPPLGEVCEHALTRVSGMTFDR